MFAPVIMTIVFLGFFRNFAKLGWVGDVSAIKINAELKTEINSFLVNKPNKIWFTAPATRVSSGTKTVDTSDYRVFKKPKISLRPNISWLPKWFIWSDTSIEDLAIIEGTGIMSDSWAEMIIGYQEAAMMREEWLFRNVWDSLSNFFGLGTVKIVWIIWPTNTLLDEVHIINMRWFRYLEIDDTLVLEETPFDGADLFYSYDQDNIPAKLKNLINSKKPTYTLEGKEYSAIYLWYDAAQEMKAEKEFSRLFDIIEEDGQEYIIAWVAKKTYTLLDMMHFVPKIVQSSE